MQVTTGPTAVLRGRLVRFAVAAVIAATAAVMPAGTAVAKPTLTPEQKAAAIVLPAMVYLEVHWQGWVRERISGVLLDPDNVSITTQCSGFAVSNDGYIVTASRCIDPEAVAPAFFQQVAQRRTAAGQITKAEQPEAITDMIATAEVSGQTAAEPPVREVYAQRGVAKAGVTSGEAMPAQVVSVEPAAEGDIGLVKIERSNQPIVTLADSSDLKVGMDLLTFGYPAATDAAADTTLEPADLTGKISADRSDVDLPLFETTASPTQSMSGGPVADLTGNVIGLVTPGPVTDEQPFNVFEASSVITDVLAKAGVKNQLGKVDKDYRAGLDAYYDGRYTEAIEAFDQVLAAVPSQAQAYEFRQQAVSLRTTTGQPAEVERSLINRYGSTVIVVVAGIVLVIGLVLGSRWRAKSSTTPPPDAPTSPADTSADAFTTDTPAADTMPGTRAPTGEVSAPVRAPELVYCVNCGVGAPPGTARCETCGKHFP